MNILRVLPVFLLGMGITAFLLSFNVPSPLIFIIVIIFYILGMALPNIYTVYFSNSLPRIERYIKRNRRKPVFAFPYALGHGSQKEIEQSIEQILLVHKQTDMQSTYRTLLALCRGQAGIAVQHAETIQREPLRSYYLAQAAAFSGDLQRAVSLNKEIREPWMNRSIEAFIACEKDDANFHQLADKSVQAARGVQKYTLLKTFERLKTKSL